MKAIMMTVRLWWFYLTYKGIKKIEIRKRFTEDFKGKIFEYVSKTNWKKDLMKIPEEEREFFKQFVGKVGLCFECDKVEEINNRYCKGMLIDSCLTNHELNDYLGNYKGYAIHITKLEIFDKPMSLNTFYYAREPRKDLGLPKNWKQIVTRPPQSWCYIEV